MRALQLAQALVDLLPAGPDGVDHREPGALLPEPAEVVVRRGVLEGTAERRVADQHARVGGMVERHQLDIAQEHLRQDDRRRALGRDCDCPHLLERTAGDELDRVDGSLGRDAQLGEKAQLVGVPGVLDRRDRRDVDLACHQAAVELGRDAGHLLDVDTGQVVEDGRHVRVGDPAQPQGHANVLTVL